MRRRRTRRPPRRSNASGLPPERPELVAEEVERCDEHDRDRLGHDPAEPALDEERQQSEVRSVDDERDDEEAQALVRHVPALVAERPEPVQGVVVRDGDEERAGRCDAVVEVRPVEQERVYGQVDHVADRADDAELRELLPVVTPPERLAGAAPERGRRDGCWLLSHRRAEVSPRRLRRGPAAGLESDGVVEGDPALAALPADEEPFEDAAAADHDVLEDALRLTPPYDRRSAQRGHRQRACPVEGELVLLEEDERRADDDLPAGDGRGRQRQESVHLVAAQHVEADGPKLVPVQKQVDGPAQRDAVQADGPREELGRAGGRHGRRILPGRVGRKPAHPRNPCSPTSGTNRQGTERITAGPSGLRTTTSRRWTRRLPTGSTSRPRALSCS